MTDKIKTTVQEIKGKYTTPVPTSLIKLLGIKKGDILIWNIDNNRFKFNITIVKEKQNVKPNI